MKEGSEGGRERKMERRKRERERERDTEREGEREKTVSERKCMHVFLDTSMFGWHYMWYSTS